MSATSIGGQAVPEGVMLRGRSGWALAVRRTDGTIAITTAADARPRRRILSRPFIRGLVAVGEAFTLGLRTLALANTMRHPIAPPPPSRAAKAWGLVSILGAVVFAAALFGMLPAFLGSSIGGSLEHAAEPSFRTIAIVLYIASIGLLPEVRRVFGYHGAEHQVVAAYEAGVDVNAENAERFQRFHPRCGTTFVVLVAVIEGAVHALGVLPSRPLVRAIEVPLAIMVAYEAVYFATAHRNRWWAKVVLAPGKALQRLTTRSPDSRQLEVGCAALQALLLLDGSEDQDQQKDDQDQSDQSTTDVHASSLTGVACSVPA